MRRGGKERQKRKVAETLIQFLIILLFTVDLRKDDEEASLWSILKGPGQGGFSSPKYQILGLFFSFNFLFFFFSFFLEQKNAICFTVMKLIAVSIDVSFFFNIFLV